MDCWSGLLSNLFCYCEILNRNFCWTVTWDFRSGPLCYRPWSWNVIWGLGALVPIGSDPNRKTLYNQRPQKRRISMYTLQFPVESHLARPDNPGRTYGAFCHHSWRLTVHQLQNPCFRYDKHDSSLLGLVLNTATLPLKRMCGEHPRSTCLEFDVLAIYAHSGWQISLFSGGARLNDNGESGHLVGL